MFPAKRCSELEEGGQIHVLFVQGGLPFTLSLEKLPPPNRRHSASSGSGEQRVVVFKAKATPQLHLALAEPPDLLEPPSENDNTNDFHMHGGGINGNNEKASGAGAAAVRAMVELRLLPFSKEVAVLPHRPRGSDRGEGFGFPLGSGSGSVELNLALGAPWDRVFEMKNPAANPFLTLAPAPTGGAVLRLAASVILHSDWLAAQRRKAEKQRAVKAEGEAANRKPAAAAAAAAAAREEKQKDKWSSSSRYEQAEAEPDPMAFAPGMSHPDEFYETDFMRRVHGRLWDRDFE